MARSRVLVVSPDPIACDMAGPAIRAYEIARALGSSHDVTLAGPPRSSLPEPAPIGLAEVGVGTRAFLELARDHDVVVAQYLPGSILERLLRQPPRLVLDLYDPRPLEVLERFAGLGTDSLGRRVRAEAGELLAYLAAADFVICASERQRDVWIGGLMLAGLIAPERYAADPSYRAFVDVVPFGVPDEPPRADQRVLKGVWPGIEENDRVLIWAGGVWDWLDPLSAVRAVELAAGEIENLKLFFMGTGRPPEGGKDTFPSMAATGELVRYARDRGLEGRRVFVNPEWTPYERRAGYLLESDLGISTHHAHLEARYAFRARILDYLWAGLPVVVTEGDVLAELVERESLGRSVPAGDPGEIATAIVALLRDEDERAAAAARASALATRLRWSEAVAPLERFCARGDDRPRPPEVARRARRLVRRSRLRKQRLILEERGPRGVATELREKWRRWRP